MNENSSKVTSDDLDQIDQKLGKLDINQPDDKNSNGNSLNKDIELFMKASELEGKGYVSQALKYYAKAYRMNPDIDQKSILRQHAQIPLPCSINSHPEFQIVVPGILTEIRDNLSDDYEPLDLPEEVLNRILSWVGCIHTVSLEQVAATCRKLYLLSRESSVWRRVYFITRASIQTPAGFPSKVSYRELYFTRPHLRTDGVYICKISYFRPGVSDGLFYQPVHMVSYYRYLRFFGLYNHFVVVSLVTTEEPKRVINLLRRPPDPYLTEFLKLGETAEELLQKAAGKKITPTVKLLEFKTSNIFIGKYYRNESTDDNFQVLLYDPQSLNRTFLNMTLNVARDKRNNVLTCKEYWSVSPSTTREGELSHYQFDTRDWGRFKFSRIRTPWEIKPPT